MGHRFMRWLDTAWLISITGIAAAQPPTLVVDLNSVVDSAPSAAPQVIAKFGSKLIFLACEAAHGCEPWVTDGTAPGTLLLVDANPAGSSVFAQTIEGRAVESATYSAFMLCTGGGLSDCEPWRSDGTPAGTFRLRDVRPGAVGSDPAYFSAVGSTIYFAADDGATGIELWKSDGSTLGTVQVEDIEAGAVGSKPRHLTVLGASLIFQADKTGETGLWKSDGTAPGTLFYSPTTIIGTESVGAADPIGPFAAELGGKVYFSGQLSPAGGNQLFVTDGTIGGTALVKDICGAACSGAPNGFRKLGAKLLFTAFRPATTGVELWATDGTGPGTLELSALLPGGNPSNPVAEPTVAGAFVYFMNEADGELWKSDGTALGTVVVEVNGPIFPRGLAAVGSQLCFAAQTAGEGLELWRSDGTALGTGPVVDLLPGSGDGDSGGPAAGLGSVCLFSGNDGSSGLELWKSDLTAGNATLVAEIGQVTAPSNPRELVAMDNRLYFSADDGLAGRELYTSDATGGGTQRVLDLFAGPTGANPTEILLLGSQLVFAADDGVVGREVFRSNGTAPGTAVYAEVASGSPGSDPTDLTVLGADLYFAADEATTGRELWRKTPTTLGLVKDLVDPGSSNPRQLTPYLGEIFFLADDSAGNLELWRSNGTTPGTTLVADLTELSGYAEHGEMTVAAGKLQIVLTDVANLTGALWTSDGSGGGTAELVSLSLGAFVDDLHPPSDFVTQGSRFLYRGYSDVEAGVEIWSSDGTPGGTAVLDIGAGAAESGGLVLHAGRAYFDGVDPGGIPALWRSDGTALGTVEVAAPAPPSLFTVGALSSAFSRLFFSPGSGPIWTSNGTSVGTGPVGGPPAGGAGVGTGFVAAGKHLFYAANDVVHGVELWAYRSPSVFSDGFEIGSASNWSASLP